MMDLLISPELLENMDRVLLTKEDALRTVVYCEETGLKLLDTASGDCLGHLRDGALTYWVRYRPEDGAAEIDCSLHTCKGLMKHPARSACTQIDHNIVVRLLGIYTHRASIEEGRGQSGSASMSEIICLKCDRPLTEQKTYFTYLGFPFSTPLPRCPECGQVYVPQSFAAGKLGEVETTLEDK